MKPEWYKEWFNSEYYLIVYKHRDKAEANAIKELILKNVDSNKISFVLDMACGAGRHAISFASEGFRVTAVDISEKLLNAAKANSLKENLDIEFHLSDFRDFNSEIKFDLALNLFTSFGYFDSDRENIRVIQKAFELLNDGGWFVLDYLNKNYILNNLIPITVENIGGRRLIQTREIEGNRVIKNINIKDNGKSTGYYESVRLYSAEEIDNIFTDTGFKISKKFGDIDGSKFDVLKSPRQIIIAQR